MFPVFKAFQKRKGKEWIASVSGVSIDQGESQDVFKP